MSSPSASPKRRRGGQPGNKNARIHGLTPRPKPPEYASEKLRIVDLSLEIAVLRRQFLRLEEAALSATSILETVEIARVIAQTASSLSRLIRAQVVVFSADSASSPDPADDIYQSLIQALEEVNREICVPDEPAKPRKLDAPSPDPGLSPPGHPSLGATIP